MAKKTQDPPISLPPIGEAPIAGSGAPPKRARTRKRHVTSDDVNAATNQVANRVSGQEPAPESPRQPKATRRYEDGDLAALWGLAAGRCSHPECRKPLIPLSTGEDPTMVVGERAHIHAFSDHGPRANALLPVKERNRYENLILLCGHCHNLVDGQWRHYTVERLRQWKAQHEAWVAQRLQESTQDIEFRALQQICDVLVDQEIDVPPDLAIINIEEKIRKNELSGQVRKVLLMGAIQSSTVARYLEAIAAVDPRLVERMRSGFVRRYREHWERGLRGDNLFFALADYSSGGSSDFTRQAAGRAVLTHLFNVCEVFER